MTQQKSGLVPGILVGLVAMLVGAAVYGAVVGITEYEIGLVAVLVGVLVGLGMMAVKPSSPVLPPLAALFGLVGAALGTAIGGTVLAVKYAGEEGGKLGYLDAFTSVTGLMPDLIGEDPKTLLFWAISAFAGFSFVNKRVKAAREAEVVPMAPPSAPEQQPEGNLFTPKNPQA
ncbi:hypothetical protein [Nonomuraea africana]|uniref:Xanthosine utilization system XapX-like protein n=1 Tax=Nonomuraea africana TaxID=46171 RepID=A0ABR9KFP1_9ACTN|nr:hypothetical protein [Nonomuraea africana]MBE1560825.1 xanthosine utilization system XapX-like protein [Nonomuraea africana]